MMREIHLVDDKGFRIPRVHVFAHDNPDHLFAVLSEPILAVLVAVPQDEVRCVAGRVGWVATVARTTNPPVEPRVIDGVSSAEFPADAPKQASEKVEHGHL
jgi:hypothetical protein